MALDVTEVECVSCWAWSPHVPLIEFVDVPGASSAKRTSKCAKQISVLHTSIRTCMAMVSMVSKSSASLTTMLVSYLDLPGSMSMRICQRRHMDTFYRAQLERIQYTETILYCTARGSDWAMSRCRRSCSQRDTGVCETTMSAGHHVCRP